MAELPLLRRFPALEHIPRAPFGDYPTPVERVELDRSRSLWLKRDDLSGRRIGGNKVRGLEFLLGPVQSGDRVVTVGPRGSTHALSTAVLARERGATTTVARWNQEMNPAARRVEARIRAAARVIDARWVPAAYAVATAARMRGAHWIPAGGASSLAVLGHVNAGLELAEQVARGECEPPERVVVPLGTGGTAAGIALAFAIAGFVCRVVAVRVVPRLVGREGRVLGLARGAATLIHEETGIHVPLPSAATLSVTHDFYGGGYGHPLERIDDAPLSARGIALDDTYSRKAFAAAASLAERHRTLLWLTFDGRLLED